MRIKYILLLLFVPVLFACSSQVQDPKKDNWDQYRDNASITIGFDNSFVPMGFEQADGSYAGFDVDLSNALFEEYGIKVKWQPIDWDMKERELKNGTIDLIWNGYSKTEERSKEVAFSMPYMENQQVLISQKVRNITSLEGMRLGAQIGSSGYLDFEDQPKLLKNLVRDHKATQYQSFNEAFVDLSNQRIDLLLIDRVYANYYLKEKGVLETYRIDKAPFASESFAIGMRKTDNHLREKIDQGLKKLYKTGEFQKISDKWFGQDVATKEVKGNS